MNKCKHTPDKLSASNKKKTAKLRETSRSKCTSCGIIVHTQSKYIKTIKQPVNAAWHQNLVIKGEDLLLAEIGKLLKFNIGLFCISK